MIWIAPLLVVTIVAFTPIAPAAFAKVVVNTIDPVGKVTDNGRQITITGPLRCSDSQRTYLRVTVTQRSTGAVTEGQSFIECSTEIRQWEVRLPVHGRAAFQEGEAIAVALARTETNRGNSDDAHQWLVPITLERQ
jgi:hypothetical protein